MPVELRNITGRPAPQGFSHVSIATGAQRLIHMAGQVGTDESGNVVGGGLGAQVTQAMANVGLVLDEAGATVADVVKLTVYVRHWNPTMFEEFGAGMFAARETRPWPDVPVTLIGVESLFTPEMMVEIEGVAVVGG